MINEDPAPKIGFLDRALPAFTLAPMPGTDAGFSDQDLAGQVTLVNVFSSWCSSCREEHPILLELAAENRVPIFGVDWKDSPGAGKLYLEQSGNPFFATGDDPGGKLGDELTVTGVPETYVVDGRGRIRYRHLGPMTRDLWQATILPLIEELEAEGPKT
jgi:cytochrome c biogenesis protein CcmG/thiol:disulfide interchange protein DsbE